MQGTKGARDTDTGVEVLKRLSRLVDEWSAVWIALQYVVKACDLEVAEVGVELVAACQVILGSGTVFEREVGLAFAMGIVVTAYIAT